MNAISIEAAFRDWWEESYKRPPAPHAVMTHVAFAEHMLQLIELLEVRWWISDSMAHPG
jgi:hypothetical protein